MPLLLDPQLTPYIDDLRALHRAALTYAAACLERRADNPPVRIRTERERDHYAGTLRDAVLELRDMADEG